MFPSSFAMPMPVPPLVAAVESQSLQQVWKFFADGGFFMILLAACSLVGVAVILFKLLSLRREIVVPYGLAAQVDGFEERMKQASGEALLREFEAGKSTLARLCAVASRNRGKSQAEINEAVQAAAREEIVHLHAGMTALDVVITVAPLLGLLGTASGLVVVFGGLGDSANHTAIALGIGRALNTTIVGLAISVPAVVAQGWFQRRIDTMAARLEVLLTRLAHALESAPRPVVVPPSITPHA
jgi:biopolymer transport protein ExbB